MKRACFALLLSFASISAFAQVSATGFINFSPNGSAYDYVITLHNTGTTSIDVLWYSWIPGADFMSALPTNVSAPAGWTGNVNGGFAGDGYSIEFVATTALNAGQTLSGFSFTSTETPAQLAANSPYFGGIYPTGMSYVYQGPAEISPFGTLVLNPVPEPVSLLAFLPALVLLRRRR